MLDPRREPDEGDRREERTAVVRRQLAQLQIQLADLQRQLAGELQGRAEDGERIEELERALAKRDGELMDRNGEIEGLRAAVREAKGATERAEGDASARRIEVAAKAAEVESLSAKLAQRDARLESAEAELGKSTAAWKQRGEQLEARSRELDRERESNLQLELEVSALRDARAKAQVYAQVSIDKASELERRVSMGEAEAAGLRTELDALRQALEKSEASIAAKARDAAALEEHLRRVLRAEDEVLTARGAADALLRSLASAPLAGEVPAAAPSERPAQAKQQPATVRPGGLPEAPNEPSLDISEIDFEGLEETAGPFPKP